MTARKPTVRRFTVTGTGRFPLDMLRYDSCWPARQDDVHNISDHGGASWGRAPSTIMLETHGEPTADRWSSFGWVVELAD